MKRLFSIILAFFIAFQSIAQCVGTQTFTLTPPPPPGGYLPGTVVNVCYTMNGWNGTNVQSNWLEGFDINLGPGWTGLTPGAPPANCNGGGGQWLWMTHELSCLVLSFEHSDKTFFLNKIRRSSSCQQ